MHDIWQDVRYAVRSLLRTPGFTVVALLTLALGIGANAAIFSVVRVVLLQPLPYGQPDRAVMIWSRWVGWEKTWVSEAELLDFRGAKSLGSVGAWSSGQVTLTGGAGPPERVGAAEVTPDLFAALGVAPIHGRAFRAEEETNGHERVVILSSELWTRRYGGDPSVLNRRILVDGAPATVVGIMPEGFRLPTDFTEDFAEPTRLWTPLVVNHAMPERGSHGLYAAARLAPGASAARANAELSAIIDARTRQGLYAAAIRQGALAIPLEDEILGDVGPRLWLLVAAVGLLLLTACANIANLLLARAEGRVKEIALRNAVGAGRRRIVAQLLVESATLALAGASAGLVLGWLGVGLLTSWAPASIPRIDEVHVDWTVIAFALVLAVGTSLLFGLAPIVRLLRVDLVDSLKEGSQSTTAGRTRHLVRGLIVTAEVAMAVVLLTGAGLMVRTLWALHHVDLGFDPDHVATMRIALPEPEYPDNERVSAAFDRMIARVRALPGVTEAGAVRSLPLGATIGDWGLDIEGYVERPGQNAKGDWQVVTPGALEAMGERLVAGRFFTPADRRDSPAVAIVNVTMARKYWGSKSPIGGRIRLGSSASDRPWVTVVGVVHDLRHNGIVAPVKEKFYCPHAQFALSTGFVPREMTLVVRTGGDPQDLTSPVRGAVAGVDPNVPLASVRPMREVVSSAMATSSFTGLLLGLFAATALLLAAVGLYGVLAYLVSQRTREIGIRAALGATPRDVVRLVLARGLTLAGAGLAAGLGVALVASRVLAALLYGVEARDPLTFVAVPAVLVVVALAACVVPAWQAARVSPLEALRSE